MTTVQKIIYDARALLNEFTDDGVIISEADLLDLTASAIRFVDMGQKELLAVGNLYKTHKIVNKSYVNQIEGNQFEIVDYMGDAQYYPLNGVVAKAYYLEVDSDATVTIEELEGGVWSTLVTINAVTDELTAYKGTITPSTVGNLIRIKFAGTYHYRHQNRCLFNVPFAPTKVPDYRPWIKYTMPSDFIMVDSVVKEYPIKQYTKDASYKWEGFKDLYVNYDFEGEIRVIYKPVPTVITSANQTLEIDDISANALSYYVAGKIAPHEYPELTNFFEQKYEEIRNQLKIKMPSSEQPITDVYGGLGVSYGSI
jgi:hypothetical protein